MKKQAFISPITIYSRASAHSLRRNDWLNQLDYFNSVSLFSVSLFWSSKCSWNCIAEMHIHTNDEILLLKVLWPTFWLSSSLLSFNFSWRKIAKEKKKKRLEQSTNRVERQTVKGHMKHVRLHFPFGIWEKPPGLWYAPTPSTILLCSPLHNMKNMLVNIIDKITCFRIVWERRERAFPLVSLSSLGKMGSER